MVSAIKAWGVWWTGLPHSPNTDSDCLKIRAITVRRPLKWQRERKKGGADGKNMKVKKVLSEGFEPIYNLLLVRRVCSVLYYCLSAK